MFLSELHSSFQPDNKILIYNKDRLIVLPLVLTNVNVSQARLTKKCKYFFSAVASNKLTMDMLTRSQA